MEILAVNQRLWNPFGATDKDQRVSPDIFCSFRKLQSPSMSAHTLLF